MSESVALWLGVNALALLVALVLDAVFGEPDWLWKRLPHPIVLIGKLIKQIDSRLNREEDTPADRRQKGRAGLCQLLLLTGIPVGVVWWIATMVHPAFGFLVSVLVGAVLLAQRSLHQHVQAVATPLADKDVTAARQALAMIVGRNTSDLDESDIARAALESLAENHSDGVVAPAFWMLIGGPVGITLYKAVNTADSMIGYKSERYIDFGKASALVDDAVNWIPARLSVMLVWISAALLKLAKSPRFALPHVFVILHDAPTHASPNAGWPEASYASALRVALGGPRVYGDRLVDAPYINADGEKLLGAGDIRRGLALFRATCATMIALVAVLAAILL